MLHRGMRISVWLIPILVLIMLPVRAFAPRMEDTSGSTSEDGIPEARRRAQQQYKEQATRQHQMGTAQSEEDSDVVVEYYDKGSLDRQAGPSATTKLSQREFDQSDTISIPKADQSTIDVPHPDRVFSPESAKTKQSGSSGLKKIVLGGFILLAVVAYLKIRALEKAGVRKPK